MIIGIIISLAILVLIMAWYMPDMIESRYDVDTDLSKKKVMKVETLNSEIRPIYKEDDKIRENYKCDKNCRFVLVLYDVDENGKLVEEIMGYAEDIDEALYKRKELKRMANIGSVIEIYTEEEYYGMKNAWKEMKQFD